MQANREELVERLQKWALEKSSLHHRLAHENPDLRTEHIASSTAYRELAAAIADLPQAQPVSEEPNYCSHAGTRDRKARAAMIRTRSSESEQ